MYTIIETIRFEQESKKIWSEEERLAFFSHISQNPLLGDVIPQGKGLRKIRWQSSGRGKRGGARVIYFNVLHSGFILMLDIYTKNDKENLSNNELKQLTEQK
ncbi:type II toxin-antitoxin system RelE/ParE family toxin [Ursidibacter arcticus]|uniref:type II toxin-antitoxin system RelE/ParE family toxin n=1 Tax=Ursidibacter TaxID=1855419 RepID=UPI0012F82A55|nr:MULTISPECIES: type II toxin-antitoxin system RelE/ParE family toxin [Ursidibacter]KAE9534247.1 DNA-binding protein [Ursidibacter arcticus]MBV6540144.1 DNA-binding protein [Ursidibacter maritimus]